MGSSCEPAGLCLESATLATFVKLHHPVNRPCLRESPTASCSRSEQRDRYCTRTKINPFALKVMRKEIPQQPKSLPVSSHAVCGPCHEKRRHCNGERSCQHCVGLCLQCKSTGFDSRPPCRGPRNSCIVAQAKSAWKLASEEDIIAKSELLVLASRSYNWKWKHSPSSCPKWKTQRPWHPNNPAQITDRTSSHWEVPCQRVEWRMIDLADFMRTWYGGLPNTHDSNISFPNETK